MQGVVDFLLLAILRPGEGLRLESKEVSLQVVPLSWLHKEGRRSVERLLLSSLFPGQSVPVQQHLGTDS